MLDRFAEWFSGITCPVTRAAVKAMPKLPTMSDDNLPANGAATHDGRATKEEAEVIQAEERRRNVEAKPIEVEPETKPPAAEPEPLKAEAKPPTTEVSGGGATPPATGGTGVPPEGMDPYVST